MRLSWPAITQHWRSLSKSAKLAWGSIACVGLLLSLLPLTFQSNPNSPRVLQGNKTLSTASLAVNVTIKLGIVVLLIYISLFLLRRLQSGKAFPQNQRLTILETVHLSPRQALHMVKAGQKVLLIGATDQSISLVGEIEAALMVASEAQTENDANLAIASQPTTSGDTFANFAGLIASKLGQH